VNEDRLLPSLARVVRGLSALFWGLPLALLACARTAVGDAWSHLGITLPVVACGLVWFGLRQMNRFRPGERVWSRAVLRAELFALLNIALAPFTWWWSRRPGEALFGQSVVLLVFSALAFLLCLNHVLRRLAAMLPDETLRADMRLFTGINGSLLWTLAILAALWTALAGSRALPDWLGLVFVALDRSRLALVVALGLLPVALTMTLVWKAKEAIVGEVYRGH
jgi:hypothetical protein